MDPKLLIAARERLLSVALECFASDPNVVGVFLGGSLAADSADAYSDIDLRVVVKPESHADFIARRCEIPKKWPDFLFNEWAPGWPCCVSHFRPFGKIDIFYLNQDALTPSPSPSPLRDPAVSHDHSPRHVAVFETEEDSPRHWSPKSDYWILNVAFAAATFA